jgi:pimeloyl-ACP methyl ester carboxylesterase
VPRFQPSKCPIDVPRDAQVQCGYLVVPEDYDEPEGATIRLPVIVVRSRSPNPAPDPLLYTAGGPGSSSLPAVWWFAASDYVADRDVVILEQRGNRYAEPSLMCDLSVWWEEKEGHTACLDSLLEAGIDPAHYTTESIVADLDALRRVLEYDQWNLFGVSYSTGVMLHAMHLHPEGIRSVVLDSVNPPTESKYEHDPEHPAQSLRVLFDDCAAAPACAAAYPELESQLYELVGRLNADPVVYELPDLETGERFTVSVTGDRLLNWMFEDSFYLPAHLPHPTPYLPLLIDQVGRGRTDLLLPWLIRDLTRHSPTVAHGLYLAVSCQDEIPLADPEIVATQAGSHPELGGYVRHAREREICEIWNLPASPPLVAEPIESEIPTLILGGTYDPITRPEWARASVAQNLRKGHFYEFPDVGHVVSFYSPCAQSMVAAFLNDPTIAPDSGCMANVAGPDFVTPQDVTIQPGIYRVQLDIGEAPRNMPRLVAMLACVLLFVVEILYLFSAGIVRLLRRGAPPKPTERGSRLAHLLAGLVAVINAAFVVALGVLLSTLDTTNPLLLYFGLPAGYAPLLFVPVATALLTVALLVFTVLAWARRYWTVPERVLFSAVTGAAVAQAGLMAYWGLLRLPV